MTLVGRVSAFFLAALAIALVCYSTIFYVFVRNYLYGEFDQSLRNALHVLSASVEIEADDVKWDPAEHGIDLHEGAVRKVSWFVCDERGQFIDHSPDVQQSSPMYALFRDLVARRDTYAQDYFQVGEWRVLQRRMSAPEPKSLELREPHEHAAVSVLVAKSRVDLEHATNRLLLLACLLPAIVWGIAAGIGRWYVGKALTPVQQMATRVRSASQADFALRLPVGEARDELAELAAEFNQLLDQLQAAYDRQSRFTGDAAHQLRNPLAVLQGQLEVARRRPRTREQYERTLDLLIEQTAELRAIVESLLHLARGESIEAHMESEQVALFDWLRQYFERWDDHPRRDDLQLLGDATTAAWVVPSLLRQLLDNLVSNALKFSQPNSQVSVTVAQEGPWATITVADRGIGISAEDRATIFEPFHRSEQARRQGIPGVGLGLSVAARIAGSMRGYLLCDSTPSQGSTFTLRIPTLRPSE